MRRDLGISKIVRYILGQQGGAKIGILGYSVQGQHVLSIAINEKGAHRGGDFLNKGRSLCSSLVLTCW